MTHPTESLHIPDTQSERDERHLAIQRVGVKDVRYPLRLAIAGGEQTTAALWNLDVALPAEKKGRGCAPATGCARRAFLSSTRRLSVRR